MPFQKGNPGGPGRPKQKPFLEWCGKWTVEKAEKYLAPIAEKGSHKNQLEAIKLIMAYGVGKPVEFSEASHQLERVPTNPDEALSFLEELIPKSAAKGTGGGPGDAKGAGDGASQVLPPERGAGESNP